MPIECHFCPATVPDPEAGIHANWIPSFWDTAKECETGSPVCADCTRTELVWNDELGDFEPAPAPITLTLAPERP